jgi:hypothetical protein
MLSGVEFIITALALCQIIETWHHSSLFAGVRAELELIDSWWSELLQCMFCLSHWVAAFLVLLGICLPVWLSMSAGWSMLCKAPAMIFGLTRLAQLINDLQHPINRTPKF